MKSLVTAYLLLGALAGMVIQQSGIAISLATAWGAVGVSCAALIVYAYIVSRIEIN